MGEFTCAVIAECKFHWLTNSYACTNSPATATETSPGLSGGKIFANSFEGLFSADMCLRSTIHARVLRFSQ